MRKTAKEIVDSIDAKEIHAWLFDATANEIYDFLRWVKAEGSWALHGRDALNVVLARENIKLQKDIRDMTKQLRRLTIFIAILALIQLYPVFKIIYTDVTILFNAPKCESTTNQTTNTNQINDKKNDTFNKTKILNHK